MKKFAAKRNEPTIVFAYTSTPSFTISNGSGVEHTYSGLHHSLVHFPRWDFQSHCPPRPLDFDLIWSFPFFFSPRRTRSSSSPHPPLRFWSSRPINIPYQFINTPTSEYGWIEENCWAKGKKLLASVWLSQTQKLSCKARGNRKARHTPNQEKNWKKERKKLGGKNRKTPDRKFCRSIKNVIRTQCVS